MRNIKLEATLYNDTEIVNELEHIATLVNQGYTSGNGWSIEGEEEKELIANDEEDEDTSTKDIREQLGTD
jgi:hypothetical protein